MILSSIASRILCKRMLLNGFAIMAIAVCSMSCASIPDAASLPRTDGPRVVTLGPGDELEVSFRYWPELDTAQAVRPDGKISLQLIDDIDVTGMTPEELKAELLQAYATKLKDPEINVLVTSLYSHRVYVGGEVLLPGLIALPGRLSALEAIMEAGGPNKLSATLSSVIIIRHVDGKRYVGSLDLKKAFKDPRAEPFYLEPSDVVFVPRTKIDVVDQWVEQYINQIVPRSLHYSWSQNVKQKTSTSRSENFDFTIAP